MIYVVICNSLNKTSDKKGVIIEYANFIFYSVEQMVERINWMADRSDKGLHQSGGIMVNYVYR